MNPFRVVALSAVLSLSAVALPVLAKSGAEWQAISNQATLTPANEEVDVHVNAVNGEAALYKNKGAAKNKEVKRAAEAKISLNQAIAAATAHTAGKAVEADLGSDWGKTSYSVKVLQADGTVMKIKLDALTGQVTGSKKD